MAAPTLDPTAARDVRRSVAGRDRRTRPAPKAIRVRVTIPAGDRLGNRPLDETDRVELAETLVDLFRRRFRERALPWTVARERDRVVVDGRYYADVVDHGALSAAAWMLDELDRLLPDRDNWRDAVRSAGVTVRTTYVDV